MDMNDIDKYFLLRKRKKINLKKIAEYIGVSVSLISQHERLSKNLSYEKEQLYKRFINNY